MWPDPSEPGKARFVLRGLLEAELWGRLKRRGLVACNNLADAEAEPAEALEKVKPARRIAFIDLPDSAQLSSHGPSRYVYFSDGG